MIKAASVDWETLKQHLVKMGESSLPDHPSPGSKHLCPPSQLPIPPTPTDLEVAMQAMMTELSPPNP